MIVEELYRRGWDIAEFRRIPMSWMSVQDLEYQTLLGSWVAGLHVFYDGRAHAAPGYYVALRMLEVLRRQEYRLLGYHDNKAGRPPRAVREDES